CARDSYGSGTDYW
nr:immunoglobulin heavy chain junction region [Macaca mulatta]MOV53497.1 immunoglobulin heavy chain junction region [Macaca mulatta]MOV53579.1 immunoglobulin heavy chain junction region [Macaca mulatta]MOV53599.1 immunoglobulin heavy chain junction region [Macaca mulatta]MOV53928.1 immunoglobulin heavy chain junction region [Macaca mulatta]